MPTTTLAMDYLVEGQEQKIVVVNTNMDTIDEEVTLLRGEYQDFHISGTVTAAAGVFEWIVPHGPAGETLTFQGTRAAARLATAGSTTTSVMVEKYTGTGAFSATNMLAATLDLGNGIYEVSTTSFAGSGANQVASGNKVRINVSAAGTGAANLTVSLQLKRV